MRNRVIRGAILAFFLLSGLMIAQEKNPSKKGGSQQELTQKSDLPDQPVLPRINGPVTLDGLSDEPAWEALKRFLWACITLISAASLRFQDRNGRVVSQFFTIKRPTS